MPSCEYLYFVMRLLQYSTMKLLFFMFLIRSHTNCLEVLISVQAPEMMIYRRWRRKQILEVLWLMVCFLCAAHSYLQSYDLPLLKFSVPISLLASYVSFPSRKLWSWCKLRYYEVFENFLNFSAVTCDSTEVKFISILKLFPIEFFILCLSSLFSSFTVYVAPVSDANLFAQVQNLHAFLFIKCQLNLALTLVLSCNKAERGNTKMGKEKSHHDAMIQNWQWNEVGN